MKTTVASAFLLGLWRLAAAKEEEGVLEDCAFSLEDDDGVVVTYSLLAFRIITDEVYTVDDYQDRQFMYKFNVCDDISVVAWDDNTTVQAACKSPVTKPCTKMVINSNHSGGYNCLEEFDTADHTASAVQVDLSADGTSCYWLGTEFVTSLDEPDKFTDFEVAFYDEEDPARGVSMTYDHGSWCEVAGMNRKLVVNFVCPDSASYFFDPVVVAALLKEEEVDERPTCEYHLELESPLACPIGCLKEDAHGFYSVCNAKGICAADPEAHTVRCLCDDGAAGELCDELNVEYVEVSSSHGGLVAAIVVCVVLLLVVVGLAAYLCYRIRAKELATTASTQYFEPILENESAAAGDAAGLSMDVQQVGDKPGSQAEPDPAPTGDGDLLAS